MAFKRSGASLKGSKINQMGRNRGQVILRTENSVLHSGGFALSLAALQTCILRTIAVPILAQVELLVVQHGSEWRRRALPAARGPERRVVVVDTSRCSLTS
ncbi:hypothetical protein VTN77DRAFT_3226 [Rasamsonia byssochlamydoides]|uniref:uncharacterized protein n=1 Tax=Rasamsonia byssochlamydoides TaxID=89139 RepID=UPI003743DF30